MSKTPKKEKLPFGKKGLEKLVGEELYLSVFRDERFPVGILEEPIPPVLWPNFNFYTLGNIEKATYSDGANLERPKEALGHYFLKLTGVEYKNNSTTLKVKLISKSEGFKNFEQVNGNKEVTLEMKTVPKYKTRNETRIFEGEID